jgi:hypothetical protein
MKIFHPFGTKKNFDVGTAKYFCDVRLTANFSKSRQKRDRKIATDRKIPQNFRKIPQNFKTQMTATPPWKWVLGVVPERTPPPLWGFQKVWVGGQDQLRPPPPGVFKRSLVGSLFFPLSMQHNYFICKICANVFIKKIIPLQWSRWIHKRLHTAPSSSDSIALIDPIYGPALDVLCGLWQSFGVLFPVLA